MPFDANADYAGTGAGGAFPGSGNDVGLWTTRQLAQVPILTQRGNAGAQRVGAVIPILGALGQAMGVTDQTEPMEKTLQRYGDFTSTQIAGLADLLSASGIVTARNPNDEDIYKGWRQVVEQAARHSKTVAEVLNDLQEEVRKTGGVASGRQRAPLTVTLTNPADIRKVGDTVAQNLMGRALTDDEANTIVAGFHAQESSAQRAAYNVGDGGGTSTANPSAETYAEQSLRSQHPLDVAGHDARRAVDEIFHLFAGGQ